MADAFVENPARHSVRHYIMGFLLAVVLTVIPFWLVMSGILPRWPTTAGIFAAAVAQMVVHLHYFLHLDASSEARWNVLSILFTAVIVLILVGGSIWIMFNLHYRVSDRGSSASLSESALYTGFDAGDGVRQAIRRYLPSQ